MPNKKGSRQLSAGTRVHTYEKHPNPMRAIHVTDVEQHDVDACAHTFPDGRAYQQQHRGRTSHVDESLGGVVPGGRASNTRNNSVKICGTS